jgi:hypothetical protein
MLHTTLRLSLLLTLALLLPVLVIRAQPYEDGGIYALFVPPGCDQPCFIGIRPGLTTLDEARGLLERHAWVSGATLYRDTGGQPRNMTWDWNGLAPAALDSAGVLTIANNRVLTLSLRTRISFGDWWLVFGQPASGGLERSMQFLQYPAQGYEMHNVATCRGFWLAQVALLLSPRATPGTAPASEYDLAAVRRQVCRRGW